MPATPPFLPFALPDIGEQEEREVLETLRSGWLTTGPKVRRLEEEFARFLGQPQLQLLAVNSATSGLHLALDALGVGPGDEVITTTHTFTATAEVIRYLGAQPVLVDIEPDSLCIDPERVAERITARTRALIVVHFAGRSADMTALLALARRHGLYVIEDAAHALPASHAGQRIGTLDSDATVFSFYANKTMTTGEGGMLVLRDPAHARRARAMRLHGIDRDAFARFTSQVPAWRYDVIAPGFKYNLTDIAAAIGLAQLPRLHAMQQRRAQIAAQYRQALADLPLRLPPLPLPGDMHAWHLFVVQVQGMERDAFVQAMFERGIGMSVHYVPLHQMSYWRESCSLQAADFPVSQAVYERTASLPIYSRMDDGQVQRVMDAVRQVLQSGAQPSAVA
ncbi:O-antigen biosynthesis aminotransferase WlbF [Melaminivora sp.]